MEALRHPADGPNNQASTLEAVLAQFAHWRATRNKIERIPQALWQAAASLYPRYSVHQIAKALRLDFVDIRNLLHPEHKKGRPPKRGESPQFLPLSLAQSGGRANCHIRMNDGRHLQVEIHLQDCSVGPLVELLQAVWSRSR
jgi:hypothetical protein